MINLYIFNESNTDASVYGIGTYIKELITSLKNSSINVYVLHLRSTKQDMETIDGIQYWHIPFPITAKYTSKDWKKQNELYYRNVVYLLKLRIKDSDNLIFHLNYGQNIKFVEMLKDKFSCKILTTIHFLNWSFSLFGNFSRFKKILDKQETSHMDKIEEQIYKSYKEEKYYFELVDHIICLSENTQQIICNDYIVDAKKTSVIYNGLMDKKIIIDKSVLRRKYNISDASIVIFAGRLDDIKGLKYAIKAFKIVLNTYPDCRFIIAGSGAFNVYLTECEDIWMNIAWTGFLNKEKLYELYAMADIGVMPSLHEQCSYVAIEMMMHGLPIIGSTSSGLCEMIRNNVTGLHIPVIEYEDRTEIDSLQLADNILYLLQHQSVTTEMGQNGRRRYLENYSSKIFYRNMLNLYESMCQHNEYC